MGLSSVLMSQIIILIFHFVALETLPTFGAFASLLNYFVSQLTNFSSLVTSSVARL